MAMSTGEKIVVFGGAALLGLAIWLGVRSATAGGKGSLPPPSKGGPQPPDPGLPGKQPAPKAFRSAPDADYAQNPITEPTLGHPWSDLDSGPNDPLKKAGWTWGYIGAVDPDEANTVIGVQVAPSDLPFSVDDVKAITPIDSILYAYYVGPGDVLVQAYYIIGPIKSYGYGFDPGTWGIVSVRDPAW